MIIEINANNNTSLFSESKLPTCILHASEDKPETQDKPIQQESPKPSEHDPIKPPQNDSISEGVTGGNVYKKDQN